MIPFNHFFTYMCDGLGTALRDVYLCLAPLMALWRVPACCLTETFDIQLFFFVPYDAWCQRHAMYWPARNHHEQVVYYTKKWKQKAHTINIHHNTCTSCSGGKFVCTYRESIETEPFEKVVAMFDNLGNYSNYLWCVYVCSIYFQFVSIAFRCLPSILQNL